MTVTFASLRRWNPSLILQLITNDDPPPSHARELDALDVEVRRAPFNHRPPLGFAEVFAASLYMLDALDVKQDSEITMFLDPDVLCTRSLQAMLDRLEGFTGALPLEYAVDRNINGLTRREAGVLHGLLGEAEAPPIHYGGECYVVPAAVSHVLRTRSEDAWRVALNRFAEGNSRFTTEEHILSYALRGVPVASLEPDVRRVWTAARHRNVNGKEQDLSLWHLPAEKDRGFRELYPVVTDRGSWFWTAQRPEYVRRASQALGMAHRTPWRFTRDLVGGSVEAFRRR